MALVTGILSDYGIGHLQDQHPSFAFTPSGPAVGNISVFAPDAVVVAPINEFGYFEADLQPTDTLRPAVHYTVTIRWGSGKSAKLPGRLQIPAEGGVLSDLIQIPPKATDVWVASTPPRNPTKDLLWYDPTTGKLKRWSE